MARFKINDRIRVYWNETEITEYLVSDVRLEQRQDWISCPSPSSMFNDSIPGELSETVHITAFRVPEAPNHVQEDIMQKSISTKEQVEVRTEMGNLIKEAIEAKYGKVRTWVETESVGPLGGVSAKVLGAVEHNGVIVPFAINVYSDERIVEALEDQLVTDAHNDELRSKLGW